MNYGCKGRWTNLKPRCHGISRAGQMCVGCPKRGYFQFPPCREYGSFLQRPNTINFWKYLIMNQIEHHRVSKFVHRTTFNWQPLVLYSLCSGTSQVCACMQLYNPQNCQVSSIVAGILAGPTKCATVHEFKIISCALQLLLVFNYY